MTSQHLSASVSSVTHLLNWGIPVGLFDDVEKLAGSGKEDSIVSSLTQDGEKFLDSETGGKFDSEIQSGGNMLDEQIEKDLPNL
jgi:hypothetical protein